MCCTKAEPRTEEISEKIREMIPNCCEIIKVSLSPDLIVHTGPSLIGMVTQPVLAL